MYRYVCIYMLTCANFYSYLTLFTAAQLVALRMTTSTIKVVATLKNVIHAFTYTRTYNDSDRKNDA